MVKRFGEKEKAADNLETLIKKDPRYWEAYELLAQVQFAMGEHSKASNTAKTLLEKNFASINCRNSKTRSGAEVIIIWNNKDLFNQSTCKYISTEDNKYLPPLYDKYLLNYIDNKRMPIYIYFHIYFLIFVINII